MSLAGFALRYKAIVTTGVTLLLLWGTVSYMTMPRRETSTSRPTMGSVNA